MVVELNDLIISSIEEARMISLREIASILTAMAAVTFASDSAFAQSCPHIPVKGTYTSGLVMSSNRLEARGTNDDKIREFISRQTTESLDAATREIIRRINMERTDHLTGRCEVDYRSDKFAIFVEIRGDGICDGVKQALICYQSLGWPNAVNSRSAKNQ